MIRSGCKRWRLWKFSVQTPMPTSTGSPRMAAHLFGAEIALVTLIDKERQWFRALLRH
jgi:hypothetical protein